MALGLNITQAPDWANKWSEALRGIIDNIVSPRTRTVPTNADLPNPRTWNTRMIWVEGSPGHLVISNGAQWIKTNDGSPV